MIFRAITNGVDRSPSGEKQLPRKRLPDVGVRLLYQDRYDWRINLWYYNQRTTCTNPNQYKATHVPMVWGWPTSGSVWIHAGSLAVLGFNEQNVFSQSNLTGQQAAAYWPEIEKIGKRYPLVSPAAAPCGDLSTCHALAFAWFDQFFGNCSNCRVDFLATHAYFCNPNTTMDFLLRLYTRYGRKIWLTEFACPHTTDPAVQLEYMQGVLPLLEAADYVERYAWFVHRRTHDGFVKTSVSLLEADSSTLTPLGQFYNSFQGSV